MTVLHPTASTVRSNLSRPKAIAGALSGVVLSLLFLASGLWKLTDLDATAERVAQLLIPAPLSMPASILVAAAETLAAILLLIPSCRRWGAWIAGLLLVGFMGYFAIFYGRLLGDDCSCFPWIRRVVGPGFFMGDAAMLAIAVVAGVCSDRIGNWKRAAAVLGAVILLVGASYSAAVIRRGQASAPETAIVDGKSIPLRQGRVLLYFFDPQCTHCEAVARIMAKWNWGETRIVGLPTGETRYARGFLQDTGLRAGVSMEAERLKAVFPFTNPPHAVALDRGKVIAVFNFGQFEGGQFAAAMRRAGFLQ